jgi:hypothetical protein
MNWKFWKPSSNSEADLARVRAVTEVLSGERECTHVGRWNKWEKVEDGKLSRGEIVVGKYERLRRECGACGMAELKTISTYTLPEDQEKYGLSGGGPTK